MRRLTGGEVVAVWEDGHGAHALDRALILARAALPEVPWDQLCRLSIGERDRALLALSEATCGARLACFVACPACGAGLELALQAPELQVGDACEGSELVWEDLWVRVRAPDSLDLAEVVRCGDREGGVRVLLARCVEARRGGELVGADALPAALVDAISARMAALDPGAEVLLQLACVECGHAWSAQFEIADHLWSELAARAHGLLRDVDAIARAYGWSEAEILALGDARRRAYLELALS